MVTLLFILLTCIVIGEILLCISFFSTVKKVKQYLYEVQRLESRMEDLMHETMNIVDNLRRR